MLTENYTIGFFRGVSILMVLILHAAIMTPGISEHKWIFYLSSHLSHGVQFFFLISGWLITRSFEQKKYQSNPIKFFFLRRFGKIFPLYFVFLNLNILFFLLCVYFLKEPVFYRNSTSFSNLDWHNYFLHLFFFQGIITDHLHTLLDGSWSIVIEVYFYLLFPFIIYKFSKTILAALKFFLISLVISIYFSMYFHSTSLVNSYYIFPIQLPCFLLGILAYRIKQIYNFHLSFNLSRTILLTVLILFFGLSNSSTSPLKEHIISALLFTVLLIFVSIKTQNRMNNLICTLGRQSYALFFLHLFLLKMASTFGFVFSTNFYLSLFTNLFISVVVSWIFSIFIFDRIDRFFLNKISKINLFGK